MNKFFDKENNRLVYCGTASNASFWDDHWSQNSMDEIYPDKISPLDYVVNKSKKYVKSGGKILEGGCGMGQQVYKLQKSGYEAIGVDYARSTIERIKKAKPNLDVRFGDVTNLEFKDETFDAYWSFGVIEHFYEGFQHILNEMKRVLKSKGFLFVTFPHMNKLRKLKSKIGKYPVWIENDENLVNFYQFVLDESKIILLFEEKGFELVKKQHLSGLKGLKDEVNVLKKPLQYIFDGKSLFFKAFSKGISILTNRFSSHSILLVFIKK